MAALTRCLVLLTGNVAQGTEAPSVRLPWAKTDRRNQARAARAVFAEQWPAPLANAAAFHVICDGAEWQAKGSGYYFVRRKAINK
jgi:hypothetical protein